MLEQSFVENTRHQYDYFKGHPEKLVSKNMCLAQELILHNSFQTSEFKFKYEEAR